MRQQQELRVQDLYQLSIADKQWHTLGGEKVSDLTAAVVDACSSGDKRVMIGTDSQAGDKKLHYVTAIVVYTPSKGGRVFYTRQSVEFARSLREKLVGEAFLSAYTALEIQQLLPENCDLSVHLDINHDKAKGESAKYKSECEGIVKGFQFAVCSKPDGWVASHVAEHIVKGRHNSKSREAA
jgi:predicted RNase H-related nuclease YkuK (DUF458 family)